MKPNIKWGGHVHDVELFLKSNNIKYLSHHHPAVFTCEEASQHCRNIPGIASKNLFLRDEKKRRIFLVISPDYKQVNLKELAHKLGVKKLSFASAETLLKVLNVTPGSVSPFGLINDTEKMTEVYIDEDVWQSPIVQFHPNDNTVTFELGHDEFQKFLNKISLTPNIIRI